MNLDKPTPEFEAQPAGTPASSEATVETDLQQGKPWTVWIVSIIALVVLLDQLSKRWALEALNDIPGRSISVIGDFLRWTLVYNEGGAMGTNLGSSALYTVVGIVILLALTFYLWQYRHEGKVAIPLSLIAGGAIGNLIDRFEYGKVVDWIDVDFIDISLWGFELQRWWTFNIADSAISVALVLMLWVSIRPQNLRPTVSSPEDSHSESDEVSRSSQEETN